MEIKTTDRRPLGPRGGCAGERNVNWKGGIAEYPNHYEMKLMRKRVLKEENYTCHYCGKYTKQIHHKDLSKHNHSRENLTACCHSCNLKFAKPHTSKYKKLYGHTLKELKAMGFFKTEMEEVQERLSIGF